MTLQQLDNLVHNRNVSVSVNKYEFNNYVFDNKHHRCRHRNVFRR